jgi:predicted esterase
MAHKEPYICEATDQSAGRPATLIFLHGYGDDAQGLPLGTSSLKWAPQSVPCYCGAVGVPCPSLMPSAGVAQQFQFHSKLPYLRWLLPNAPHNFDAMGQAWYLPKALPNALKPRVPGRDNEGGIEEQPDDEEGILRSVDRVDEWVEKEIERGVEPGRIVVGGFSQGCAVSLVWGLVGKMRDSVAGVVLCSGYFPLRDRIGDLRKDTVVQAGGDGRGKKKWLYLHGSKDMLVPSTLFWKGKAELEKHVNKEDIEDHVYEGLSHSTSPAELRDMLMWLETVVPP